MIKADGPLRSTTLYSYGMTVLFLVAVGAWLMFDLLQEKDRLVHEAGRLALQKSQFMAHSFGDTFLASDYVLRDVIGHVDFLEDMTAPSLSRGGEIIALLKEKVVTVPGIYDLVLLDSHCRFVYVARYPVDRRSRQPFCSGSGIPAGQSLRIQYFPAETAASHRPSVVMSRIIGSNNGRLLGAAMIIVDLQYAQDWILKFEINVGDILAILDADSMVLARNPQLPSAISKRTQYTPSVSVSGQPKRREAFTMASPFDGHKRVLGASSLERFPFLAIVGFDMDGVLRSWRHRSWQFFIGYGVMSVLSLLALREYLSTARQREEAGRLAITDALTGIANRRYLMDLGYLEVARAKRHGRPLSVLLLDIDHFKVVNDTWGHPTGDNVIRKLAKVLENAARKSDLAARLGGEEFAMVLSETDLPNACAFGERLRTVIEALETEIAKGGGVLRFTVSIGAASLTTEDSSFETMLSRADQALYRAKKGGRNRVEV